MKWKSDPSAGGAEHRADDLAHFIRILEHLSGAPQDLFSPAEPVWVARAPGRLDVMGGIADYSGSL
ncbi:MAG TPA: hypothetical protein VGJ84_12590, partial [Polyangiaceae bacterium]